MVIGVLSSELHTIHSTVIAVCTHFTMVLETGSAFLQEKTMNLLSKNKPVALITILSGIVSIACLLLAAIGANYHFEVFNNPALLLTLPGVDASASKWSMICDMFGYYMLLLPVIYYFHDWMKNKTAWSNLITFCGLAYVLIGAIGAAILAVVYPKSIESFHQANAAAQPLIQSGFEFANTLVYDGMWNLLEVVFAGMWWLAIGTLLLKQKTKAASVVSVITGLFALLDALAGILSIAPLHELALNGYLYGAVIWAFVIGVVIYKNRIVGKTKYAESVMLHFPPPHYQKKSM